MMQPNLFKEIEEDLERQKLEDLWRKYGPFLIGFAFIIVLGTSVVTAWTSWQKEKSQTTTARLIAVTEKSDSDYAKKDEALSMFALNKNGTTQAAMARFYAAALAIKQGDTKKALAYYDAVSHDVNIDIALRQLADLYSIELQMSSEDPKTLQAKLDLLLVEPSPWHDTALEDKGYLALKAGDNDKAKQIFLELSQEASAPHDMVDRAKSMLRYLGG
jgi:hypothetical protein